MISVNKAEKIIAKNLPKFPAVLMPLEKAFGHILREDIKADRDLPAFHKALMDGIALKAASVNKGNRTFAIESVQAAGKKALTLKDKDGCIEIMTGAVMPKGCDSIIPVEKLQFEKNTAVLNKTMRIKEIQFVRPQGSDHKKGQVMIKKGNVLLPPLIAVAATAGKGLIKVSAKPKIAIITTGDELVGLNEPVKSFQIRKSNVYALKHAFEQDGLFDAAMFHLRDHKAHMKRDVKKILKNFDVIVTSGGVSKGKYDYLPEVFESLGVRKLFHGVNQRPGRPLWFGRYRKKCIFALPGNPVSTLICAYRYVLPNLRKALGQNHINQEIAQLGKRFIMESKLTYYLPVTLKGEGSRLLAEPVSISGSGDIVALARSDGFVELNANQQTFPAGAKVRLCRWK